MSGSQTCELTKKKCLPCEGGIPPLSEKRAKEYLKELKDWKLGKGGKFIFVEYQMKNFIEAINLINKIAVIAEEENHHPDFHLTGYRRLVIEITTHAIGGLSENDFILAAKIDQIPKKLKSLSKK